MDETTILHKIDEVLRALFQRSDISVSRETTAHDIDEWDSLNHVYVILGVEKAFHIHFTHLESASFENVGDMVDTIQKHLAAT